MATSPCGTAAASRCPQREWYPHASGEAEAPKTKRVTLGARRCGIWLHRGWGLPTFGNGLILSAFAPGPAARPIGADKMFGNKDPDFIEERKTQLQQWLDDAVANPEARGVRQA